MPAISSFERSPSLSSSHACGEQTWPHCNAHRYVHVSGTSRPGFKVVRRDVKQQSKASRGEVSAEVRRGYATEFALTQTSTDRPFRLARSSWSLVNCHKVDAAFWRFSLLRSHNQPHISAGRPCSSPASIEAIAKSAVRTLFVLQHPFTFARLATPFRCLLREQSLPPQPAAHAQSSRTHHTFTVSHTDQPPHSQCRKSTPDLRPREAGVHTAAAEEATAEAVLAVAGSR